MILDMPLPAALEQKLKPQNAKLHFAVGAFAAEEVTLGHAADIAGISQTEFMHELSHRRIPMHYEQLEFAEDLVIIAKLNEKLGRACHQ